MVNTAIVAERLGLEVAVIVRTLPASSGDKTRHAESTRLAKPAEPQPKRLELTPPRLIDTDTRHECANPGVLKLRQLRERGQVERPSLNSLALSVVPSWVGGLLPPLPMGKNFLTGIL